MPAKAQSKASPVKSMKSASSSKSNKNANNNNNKKTSSAANSSKTSKNDNNKTELSKQINSVSNRTKKTAKDKNENSPTNAFVDSSSNSRKKSTLSKTSKTTNSSNASNSSNSPKIKVTQNHSITVKINVSVTNTVNNTKIELKTKDKKKNPLGIQKQIEGAVENSLKTVSGKQDKKPISNVANSVKKPKNSEKVLSKSQKQVKTAKNPKPKSIPVTQKPTSVAISLSKVFENSKKTLPTRQKKTITSNKVTSKTFKCTKQLVLETKQKQTSIVGTTSKTSSHVSKKVSTPVASKKVKKKTLTTKPKQTKPKTRVIKKKKVSTAANLCKALSKKVKKTPSAAKQKKTSTLSKKKKKTDTDLNLSKISQKSNKKALKSTQKQAGTLIFRSKYSKCAKIKVSSATQRQASRVTRLCKSITVKQKICTNISRRTIKTRRGAIRRIKYKNSASKQGNQIHAQLFEEFLEFLRGKIKDRVIIYTDGSKLVQGTCTGTGAAFVVYENGEERAGGQFQLPNEYTTSQAELYAIQMAVSYVEENQKCHSETTIFSDSMTSVELIRKEDHNNNNNKNQDKLVRKIQKKWNSLEQSFNKIRWVPGHARIKGNERADKLAKEAARCQMENDEIIDEPRLLSTYKMEETATRIVDNTTDKKWSKQWDTVEKFAPLVFLLKHELRILRTS